MIAVDNHRVVSNYWRSDWHETEQESGSTSTSAENSNVYIHMFAFRFKNGVTSDQKNHCVTEIRKLKDEIKEVQESWVGLNISPRGKGYELGGSMKFADAAAFERYNAPGASKIAGLADPAD